MKTMKTLRNYVIGIIFGIWSMIPFMHVYGWIMDESVSLDSEAIGIMIGWTLFSVISMYIVHHVVRGIVDDIKSIKNTDNKKEVAKA